MCIRDRVYAIQKFVGTPPASYFGMREGRKVLEQFRAGKIQAATDEKKAPDVYKRQDILYDLNHISAHTDNKKLK